MRLIPECQPGDRPDDQEYDQSDYHHATNCLYGHGCFPLYTVSYLGRTVLQ